jgi:hypothetical protein
VWQAATARARIPEVRRRDATCIIDEAHNVLNLAGSVSDMLAEARGYHLSLVLAHQNRLSRHRCGSDQGNNDPDSWRGTAIGRILAE